MYRVSVLMPEEMPEAQRPKPARPLWRRLEDRLPQADPRRLSGPAGERIIDIYRNAYVNGGLTTAQARTVHRLWHQQSLQSLPSLLLIFLPASMLLAIDLGGMVEISTALWIAILYTTVANVLSVFLWQSLASPLLHARGVPVVARSLAGCLAVSLAVALGYLGLYAALPRHMAPFAHFLPLFLPFQLLLFTVILLSYDIHIDYAKVTGRWTETPLQRLLPFDKRGKLIFLRASDHYVIVRTTKGEHELRMRFSDALARIGSARGLQVHRSFWVAQDHLSTPRKEGRRMVMRVDGVVIPISATYRDAVRRHLDLSVHSARD